jgi:hypothetical protein
MTDPVVVPADDPNEDPDVVRTSADEVIDDPNAVHVEEVEEKE